MSSSRLPIPQGTLDMLILQILSLEPAHGYGIAHRSGRRCAMPGSVGGSAISSTISASLRERFSAARHSPRRQ